MAIWAVAKIMTNGGIIGYRFVNSQDESENVILIQDIKSFIGMNEGNIRNIGLTAMAGGQTLKSKGKIPVVGLSEQFGRKFEAVDGEVQDTILAKVGLDLYLVANYTGKVTQATGEQLIMRNGEFSNASFKQGEKGVEIEPFEDMEIDGIHEVKFMPRDIEKVQMRTNAKLDMLGAPLAIGTDGELLIKAAIGDIASIPDGCTKIIRGTFEGRNENCATVKRVACPKTLRSIESTAFAYMDFLDTIELNDGLEVLGDQFLFGCKKVKELRIPRTVNKINRKAFFNSGVRKVYVYRRTVAQNEWLTTDAKVTISIVG